MSNEDEIMKAKQQMDKKLVNVARGCAINLFNKIIVASPVDTGRFRANWQTTINTPAQGVLDTEVPTSAESGIRSIKITDTMYLTNNLPYAKRLEEGWSQQRPSGWVATLVKSAQSSLDEAIKEVK